MVEISTIAYCKKQCKNLNPDGTCKVLKPIPDKVKTGFYCSAWDFDGEEP